MNKTYIYKKRLKTVFLNASQSEIEYGLNWYHLAGSELKEYNYFAFACGVTAILSPQKSWELNLYDAKKYLKQGNWAGIETNYNIKEKLSLLSQNMTAKEIAKVVYGKNAIKTRDFFWALYTGSGRVPVIDRHIYGAAGLNPDKTARTNKRTREIKRAIVELAREFRIPAGNFQAVIWVAYREGILGNKRHVEKTVEELPF